PHLSLSGLVGFQSLETGNFVASTSQEGVGLAGIRWRLFDFGRVDAEVNLAKGREAEALAAYRASVLRATEDVENALSVLIQSRVQTETLSKQITALTLARDQTQIAYEGGVVPLIDVLDADRELLAASDRLAAAKAIEARAAVASFRALGGGWSS